MHGALAGTISFLSSLLAPLLSSFFSYLLMMNFFAFHHKFSCKIISDSLRIFWFNQVVHIFHLDIVLITFSIKDYTTQYNRHTHTFHVMMKSGHTCIILCIYLLFQSCGSLKIMEPGRSSAVLCLKTWVEWGKWMENRLMLKSFYLQPKDSSWCLYYMTKVSQIRVILIRARWTRHYKVERRMKS